MLKSVKCAYRSQNCLKQFKHVTPAFNSKWKYEILDAVIFVPFYTALYHKDWELPNSQI